MKALITIILLLTLFCACKTRKVSTQTSTVSQSSSVAVNKTITDSSSTKSIDTSKTVTSSVTEAKTSQSKDAMLYADSIVQTKNTAGTKTVIYPTKGTPLTYRFKDSGQFKVTDSSKWHAGVSIRDDRVIQFNLDSTATTKRDSTGKTKNTEAVGSGTTYAKWVGIAILVFAILMAVVIYLRSKKP